MRIDLHIHSSYSNDGSHSPNEILKHAKKKKLDGIAITDHNEFEGSLKLWKEHKGDENFVVIPGMEVSTSEGHVLAMGITEGVPKGLSPESTIQTIEEQGGLAIASHPYRFWSGLGEDVVKRSKFKILEVVNGRSLKKENLKAGILAENLGCARTGGSDSHSLENIGDAFTVIDTTSYNLDDIMEEIRRRKTKGEGSFRTRLQTPAYAVSCVYLWLKRGMRRI